MAKFKSIDNVIEVLHILSADAPDTKDMYRIRQGNDEAVDGQYCSDCATAVAGWLGHARYYPQPDFSNVFSFPNYSGLDQRKVYAERIADITSDFTLSCVQCDTLLKIQLTLYGCKCELDHFEKKPPRTPKEWQELLDTFLALAYIDDNDRDEDGAYEDGSGEGEQELYERALAFASQNEVLRGFECQAHV